MTTTEPDDRGLLLACPHCGQRNRLICDRLGQTFRCAKCHLEIQPPGEPIEVKSEAVFDALANHSAIPVLVEFWAPWCGPCKMVAPELIKVAGEGRGRWLVTKINGPVGHKMCRHHKAILIRAAVSLTKLSNMFEAVPAAPWRPHLSPRRIDRRRICPLNQHSKWRGS